MAANEEGLTVEGLESHYGASQILFGLSLAVAPGEVVTLLGRNGMGKTTTVKSIMGIVRPTRGQVRFAGQALQGLPSYRIAQAGLGLVPEGRHVFPNLTVRENLIATAANRPLSGRAPASDPWTLDKILALFPSLKARQGNYGNQLSGGEQQMLAIGRALMTNPRLLILDEATEGLAPLIRAEIWRCLDGLKAIGQSILVIDKNVDHLVRIADRHVIVERGLAVWTGTSAELAGDAGLRERYLGV